MPIISYVPPDFYNALREEGYTLPDECGDITLELPVDGIVQLVFRINVDDVLLAKIGRALARIGTASYNRRAGLTDGAT